MTRFVKTWRARPATLLRRAVQLFCVLAVLLAAYQFSGFLHALRSGAGPAFRPPVVEGFLPVAGIVALKGAAATGQLDLIHPAGLVLLAVTLVTALLFRRALCSWVCPLGALSEFLWRIGRRIPWRLARLPKWADWGLLALKYGVFLFVVKTFFFLPAREALAFLRLPYYAVSDVKMFDFFAGIGPVGIAVLGLLLLGTLWVRSFWCRYLCPYGAVLGVLGLVSPLLLKKDPAACNGCGLCDRACPGAVAVAAKKRWVVSTECTGCSGCVEACPREGAISLRLAGVLRAKPLLVGALFLSLFFGTIVVAKATGHWQTSLTFEQYRQLDRAMRRPAP